MVKVQLVDILIIVSYLLLCLGIGVSQFSKIKTLRDYAIGIKQISTTTLVITIFATYIGAGATIGAVGKIYSLGIIFAVSQFFKPLFWLIMSRIYTKNIAKFQQFMSISDIMEYLYGKLARWVTNIASIFLSIGVSSVQMLAMGNLLSYYLGFSIKSSILISSSILIFYSALGGIRAITFTDVFQFGIFFIIIPISVSCTLSDKQVYAEVINQISLNHLATELADKNNLLLFLSLIFYAISPGCGGAFIQRFLMAKDSRQLRQVFLIIPLIHIAFVLLICLIGFFTKVKFPDIEPDKAYIHFIINYLPAGLSGLMIVGMLAVMMSTADSWLNNASILFTHDVVKQLKPNISNRAEIVIARLSTIVAGLAAIAMALKKEEVLDLLWFADNFWDPIVLIPLAAGFIGLRTDSKSFVAGIALALTFTFLSASLVGEFSTISFCCGIIGNFIGLLGLHYLRNKSFLLKVKYRIHNIAIYLKRMQHSINNKPIGELRKLLDPNTQKQPVPYITFGIYSIIYFVLPFFIKGVPITGNIINDLPAYLYIIAAFLGLLLISAEFWSLDCRKKYLQIFWYFTLLFCIPFVNSYVLLIATPKDIDLINIIFSALLLAVLVDYAIFFGLMLMGVTFAYGLQMFLRPAAVYHLQSNFTSIMAFLYAIPAFAMFVFNRMKEKHKEFELNKISLFASAIAHELGNPIAALSVAIKNLRRDANNNNDEEILTIMEAEIKKSRDIIQTILFSSKSVPILKNVQIKNAINDVIRDMPITEEERSIIKFKSEKDFVINADEVLLRQVLINLIKNALYYTSQNPNGVIEVSTYIKRNKGIISVKDNGQGIHSDDLDKIFEPFFTTKEDGKGIGLAFCKSALALMEAEIKCHSVHSEFTEFIIEFPLLP